MHGLHGITQPHTDLIYYADTHVSTTIDLFILSFFIKVQALRARSALTGRAAFAWRAEALLLLLPHQRAYQACEKMYKMSKKCQKCQKGSLHNNLLTLPGKN